jgi:hypothetical protein
MQPVLDPAVAAVEAALRKAEGPFNISSSSDTNPAQAHWQRWEFAVELTRIVDRTRLGVALVRLMDRDGRPVDEDDDTTRGALTT